MKPSPTSPLTLIGGGIVGLATAWAMNRRHPDLPLRLLEKEESLAPHQTGHNSGVIHSGLYYKPGSAKAKLCVEGGRALKAFCAEYGVPFETCGKLVVATSPQELPRLEELERRGQANGVEVRRLGPEAIREYEPHASGLAALHVPETGIVDYTEVSRTLGRLLTERGVEVRLGCEVRGAHRAHGTWHLRTSTGELEASGLVACPGLFSDRLARAAGLATPIRIVPFRGEYHLLKAEAAGLVRNLLYPVPDPSFPFLGVHFTRSIHGEVDAGPNAVMALAREGYTWSDISGRDLLETFAFPGFWRLARRHAAMGLYEVRRSFSLSLLARDLQRLIPAIRETDLIPGPAGVRAQALDPQGNLLDDFAFAEAEGALFVLNAPSPAATASFAIGDHLAEHAAGLMNLG